MDEYKYINEYEKQETEKYEGIYTAVEIELNKSLYEECSKDNINYVIIEGLLKQGADPLGGTEICGWDVMEHIYGDLVAYSQMSDSVNLPKITEMFLKYGMDIENPRVPYDGENSINPMWNFAFVANENAIIALKMLLDNGISADSFACFWGHSMTDFFHVDCGDPQNDEFWNNICIWTFKMLLLGASYDHILENDKGLQEFICCDYNTYDVHKFRDFDKYNYYFDTSHCQRRPELYESVIYITEKESGNRVWTIGVGLAGRKILVNMNL